MVNLTSPCNYCGLVTTISLDVIGNDFRGGHIVCPDCYEKHLSPSAIRDKKLEKVLKKSFLDKLKRIWNV